MTAQPRVHLNDWRSLAPPPAPDRARLSVSFVIPARGAPLLPHVLASLATQTYPDHLVEVIVVDDGSDPPLLLPELRPERTRLVRATDGWGRAHACSTGAAVAEGDVIHWLDADMALAADELERHMRWHHLLDHAVVMGTKTFIDPAEGLPSPAELHRLLAAGEDPFAGDRWRAPHDWVEEYVDRTDRLTAMPHRSYLVHVGACASVGRELYESSGGMDVRLRLGEDIELGYRLAQKGAVFVPEDDARSWHLGRSTVMRREDEVNRYNRPRLRDAIADMRHWRGRGRVFRVPWFEVVVDARGHDHETVAHTVEGCLAGNPTDLRVLLVGDWSSVPDGRHDPLDDPWQDVRMLAAEYSSDARVTLVDEVPASAFPSMFRVWLPTGWSPGRTTLRVLLRDLVRDNGLLRVPLPDGSTVRVERTSTFERAARVLASALVADPAGSAELDACVTELAGALVVEDLDPPFTHVSDTGTGAAPSAASRTGGGTPTPSRGPGAGATTVTENGPAAAAAREPGAGDGRAAAAQDSGAADGPATDAAPGGVAGRALGRVRRAVRGRRTP